MTHSAAPILLFPTHYLGNLILGLPWVLQVLKSHPDARLVLDSRFATLVSLVLSEDVDILYYPRAQLASGQPLLSRFGHYWRFLRGLRADRRRPLLDLEGERFTGVLSLLSGCHHRVGPVGKHAERFYTRVLDLDYHRHRFNAFGEICAGFTDGTIPRSHLPYRLAPELDRQWQQKLPDLAPGKPCIAIHPGASVDYKLWSRESFIELAGLLANRGLQVVWVGAGAMDADIIADLQRRSPDTVSACDRLNLPELVALLQSCAGFIGNDSGPMHLAASTGIPVIALFGPSKESIWAPLGENSHVLRGSKPCGENCDAHHCEFQYHCLTSLLPGQVLAAVARHVQAPAREVAG